MEILPTHVAWRPASLSSKTGQRILSPCFSHANACLYVMDVWFVLSLDTLRGCSFANIRGAAAREESSKNEMVTHSASDNTKSGHAMLAAAARMTQTLAARAIRRQTNGGLLASRPVASESRRLAHSWWAAAAVRLDLAACTLLVGNSVGAGESGRRGCWVSVSNPAS
jgi:hypothetical protein